MTTFYKWTRETYTRNTVNGKWRLQADQTTREAVTEWKADSLTGSQEVRFFRALGAWVRVTRYYSGKRIFTNISPDKLTKKIETFEPVQVNRAACGNREYEALRNEPANGCFDVLEDSADHFVVRLGSGDTTADYDAVTRRFVG